MTGHYKAGFSHPIIDAPAEPRGDLFSEMNLVATELRESSNFCGADLEVAFRQLQKVRMPELPDSEFQPLFAAWLDAHEGKMRLELGEARSEIRAYLRERQAGKPMFDCPCGRSVDPSDVNVMRFHQPHIIAARGHGRV